MLSLPHSCRARHGTSGPTPGAPPFVGFLGWHVWHQDRAHEGSRQEFPRPAAAREAGGTPNASQWPEAHGEGADEIL